MKRHHLGFTMIEILAFIIVSSLLMSVILLGATTALRSAPSVHQQWAALQSAQGCMEYFLNRRRLNGFSSLVCPSTPSTSACPVTTGLSVAANISCTTWNGDSNYKTITINVSGLSTVSLSTQIGDY